MVGNVFWAGGLTAGAWRGSAGDELLRVVQVLSKVCAAPVGLLSAS